MEGIRTFLESSTIHGLSYISTTRRYARLLWMCILIMGFSGAGYMIQEAFQNWAANPETTNIKTLPLSEITLPKMTVCPPKNTFTDLNYDLWLALTSNKSISAGTWKDLFVKAVQLSESDNFETLMQNLTKFQEDKRFYNWYHGYSEISLPSEDSYKGFTFRISSSAASGVVKSQNFGEAFNKDLLEKKLYYNARVVPPENIQKNANITLHIKIEKLSIKELHKGFGYYDKDKDEVKVNYVTIDSDLTIVHKNYSPPGSGKDIILERKLTETDLSNLTEMPGFKVSWYYSGDQEVVSDPKYLTNKNTRNFIK